ncbi:uncharacterized protein [Prorops nasuta]|uniref:uncharacterized protein n=1 Tax=Prorops nasuta TaxID=863751 RepID=UPI0034CF5851
MSKSKNLSKHKKLFALVKWTEGTAKNTYSTDVPVEWIRNFDFCKYNSDYKCKKIPYAIEWRNGRKRPKGGWNLFDGLIIQISEKQEELENTLQIIEGVKSPRCSNQGLEENTSDDNPHSMDTSSTEDSDIELKEISKKPRYEASENSAQLNAWDRRDNLWSNSKPKESQVSAFPDYKELSKTMQEQSDKIMQLEKDVAELKRNYTNLKKMGSYKNCSEDEDENEKMVEIYKGSGIKITENQWNFAKTRNSYTGMAIALMMASFPLETLLRSNLKGGAPKIKTEGEDKVSVHTALDPNKLKAIKDAVKAAHPVVYNASILGTALNNKLNQLRHQQKPQ